MEKKHVPYGPYEKYFKRPIDFCCGLAAVVVFSWLYLILIVLGAIFMRGNPFFTQDRPGKDVKPGDTCCHGDFKIDFVSCDHGTGAPDAVGVVVTVDGKKIYEAGDTCLRLDRVDEYKAKGPFDVMIAPINGMYGNLNATDCAKLADV